MAKAAAVGGQGGAYDHLVGVLWPNRDPDEARDALAAAVDRLDRFDRDSAWVAVVHADGNGLGQLFERVPEFVVGTGSDRYADGLRQLSHAIEQATLDALRTAVGELAGELTDDLTGGPGDADAAPVVIPLLSGGGDVTVVCEGESALPFAASYLYAFEAATRHRLAAIAPSVLTGLPDRVSAAAGVAIVKTGSPLVNAYRLAADLAREAKAVKTFERGSSALSFHVLHDASATTLRQVRDRTTFVEPTAE
nr:hypothetical protein [Micromonospora sp. DSM 115978]